jgi:hypothetical protein
MQIQRADCHDQPFDRWKRPQFHEFAAFFPRAGRRDRNSASQRTLRFKFFRQFRRLESAEFAETQRRPGLAREVP